MNSGGYGSVRQLKPDVLELRSGRATSCSIHHGQAYEGNNTTADLPHKDSLAIFCCGSFFVIIFVGVVGW